MWSSEDYPKTFEEFLERFPTEDDCLQYIRLVRWPDGFCCPYCGSRKYWEMKRLYLRCSECHRETSVTAGTVFEGTRKPLRLWFHVIVVYDVAKDRCEREEPAGVYGVRQLPDDLGLAA